MTFFSPDCYYGNIIELRDDSVIVNQHSFNCNDGAYPQGDLVQLSNGKLYGTCSVGGLGCTGIPDDGKLFSFDMVDSIYTVLATFTGSDGIQPCHGVVAASNGKLYGMTQDEGLGYGTIYCYNLSNDILSTVHYFDGVNGAYPSNGLIEKSDGKLYGLTTYGGTQNKGVLFAIDTTSSNFVKLHDFISVSGIEPYGKLLAATNGKLYGTACHGGTNNAGVLFSFDADSSIYTVVFDFDIINGKCPLSSVIQATDGKIYGVCSQGGNDSLGTLFSYDLTTTVFTKHFDFNTTSGKPVFFNDLMQASNGIMYAMTQSAGANGAGTVYKFNPITDVFTKIHDFGSTTNDGGSPHSSFIELLPGTVVKENEEENEFNVYPNPSSDFITIRVNTENLKELSLSLSNALGKTFIQSNIKVPTSEFKIDISKFPTGIYFLQLNSKDGFIGCRKIIKL